MGIAGGKPKPAAVRAISGSNGPGSKHAGNAKPSATLRALPPPPKWMTDQNAIDEWNSAGPDLIEMKLLTRANVAAYALACMALGKIISCQSSNMRDFSTMMGQYRMFVNDFGLLPCSAVRARMPGEDVPEAENPFARNKTRVDRKAA